MLRRWSLVLGLLALLFPLSAAVAAVVPSAELPLGKARFAIAVGGLSPASRTNWVRLGLYDFKTDGTVSERHWHWSQRNRVKRAYTGFVAGSCPSRNCNVQTAGGYQSTGASKTLTGTYAVSGNRLTVTWSGGQREEWDLTSAASGSLASVELAGSNFGITHGYGYGSNAAWNARVPMSTIAAMDHNQFVHRYDLWKSTGGDPYIDHGDGNPFWVRQWTACGGGNCLGAVTGSGSSTTQYYVAPANSPTGHRRDTLWGWRTANADGRDEYCYTGNSHVKPIVQIIDDNGRFHGWVGVEGSLDQTTNSVLADDIGIFRIAG